MSSSAQTQHASTPETSRRTGRMDSMAIELCTAASRDAAALRRKFNEIVNLPKPTGSPPDVRRSKELSRAIKESLEMPGLSDDEILDMTEEMVADAADDEQFDTGSGNSSLGRRSSDTPRPSSVLLRLWAMTGSTGLSPGRGPNGT
ncbi:hypothetical protein V1525DRAFT_434570 [Lipomyces kononenkoae]|uniref:Uncharacterized protein n=1 Tax=Lipomyces kononenkoae TaxID=34357 RepID=A0ACC3SWR8_LIPKO